jgi:hypothetical protein
MSSNVGRQIWNETFGFDGISWYIRTGTVILDMFLECLCSILKIHILDIPFRFLNADTSEFSEVNQKISKKLPHTKSIIIFRKIILIL